MTYPAAAMQQVGERIVREYHFYATMRSEFPDDYAHVGEAQLHSDGSLWAVEIFKPYRRRGLGRRLVKELMNRARALGHSYVWLYVDEDNVAGVALYKSLGFTTAARTLRGLMMRRDLPFMEKAK